MKTKKVSVYIITYNEEKKIGPAIKSVINWADEIIVADSFSTDKTATIAESLGARVIQIPFNGFGNLRNEAIKHCQHEWIFSLDADERCTAEAQQEILNTIEKDHSNSNAPVAYLIPRKNFLLGQWVKHSGWYPDYRQPQLFRNGKLHYTTDAVHEGYISDGTVDTLTKPIWQFPFENLAQMLHKANRYSSLGAEKLKEKNKQGGFAKGALRGSVSFIRHYIFKLGFLDGRAGFAIALGNFIGTFYKYAKLAELQNDWQEPK